MQLKTVIGTSLASVLLLGASGAEASTVTIALEGAHSDDVGKALQLLSGGDPKAAEAIFSGVIASYEHDAVPGQTYRCADDLADAAKVSVTAMVATQQDVTILSKLVHRSVW